MSDAQVWSVAIAMFAVAVWFIWATWPLNRD